MPGHDNQGGGVVIICRGQKRFCQRLIWCFFPELLELFYYKEDYAKTLNIFEHLQIGTCMFPPEHQEVLKATTFSNNLLHV